MCSRFLKCFRMRSGRVHAEDDKNTPSLTATNDGIVNDAFVAHQELDQHNSSDIALKRVEPRSTPMHSAAINGDRALLSKLLHNHSHDIDAGDQFDRTPLILAVLADRPECVETLIKHGAKVNNGDNTGRTALHWAAYKGNLRLCKLLLAKGANWKIKDKEGKSALHLAACHDNTKCLRLLIKQLEPGEQDEQDSAKKTALHWSSAYGNEEAVRLLIKHNFNIGIPDVDGKTPLHWAASAGHSESAVNTVQFILDTEPNVITWQDYEGRTALHLAVAQGNQTITQQLIDFQCNVSVLDNMFRTPLHCAAVLGHTHVVNLLLDASASVTSSDANGATPLHYAAQNNHADTVAAFLNRGINDEPDFEGRTALMWAAGKGADDVINRMIEIRKPDINATDKTGATALHAAATCGHPSTIEVLLEHGADVNVLDHSKHTPLFRAAQSGHVYVAKALTQGGAHCNIVDQDRRSPLHWAALGGHACICAILVMQGLDPNIKDLNGTTPLQSASCGGFTNSMQRLLERGANPNLQDSDGMTALHCCCSSGYVDAAKLLLDHKAFPNHVEYTEERLTPLDYALLNEHHQVAQYMIEQGALSITGIRDMAAIRIQAYFRGYRVRKTFVERKILLMKHEQLRKDAAKKKVEMIKKSEPEGSSEKDDVSSITELQRESDEENSSEEPTSSVFGDPEEITKAERILDHSKKLCWDTETTKTNQENEKKQELSEEKEDLASKVKASKPRYGRERSDSGINSDFVSEENIPLEELEVENSIAMKRYEQIEETSSALKNHHSKKAKKSRKVKNGFKDVIVASQNGNMNVNNSNSNGENHSAVDFAVQGVVHRPCSTGLRITEQDTGIVVTQQP